MAKRFLDAGFAKEDVVVGGRGSAQGESSWPGTAGRGEAGPSCSSRISTWSRPSARTGASIPSPCSRRTATSTAAARATTRRRPRSGWRTSSATSSEGFRPSRDLIVALTADEEGGGPYSGVDWLLKNRTRADRRRVLPQRRRLGRDARRQAALEPRPGGREALRELSAGGQEPRRTQLDAGARRTRSTAWPRRSSAWPPSSSTSG